MMREAAYENPLSTTFSQVPTQCSFAKEGTWRSSNNLWTSTAKQWYAQLSDAECERFDALGHRN
jgi:hypothetical protein